MGNAHGDASARTVESMLAEISAGAPESPVGGPGGRYDRLFQLSMADPHTGLANRMLLVDRLSQAMLRRRRHGGEVVVCHVELDNLDEINADQGFAAGTAVLRETTRRLTGALRVEDTVGRVGGSELVVVATVTDAQVVGPLIRRIQRTLDEPVELPGGQLRLTSSLGVAVALAEESVEEALDRADRSTRVIRR
jgi:diguanylate cyclase (GGDEF)-like protein